MLSRENQFAAERLYFWKAVRDLRAAHRDGDAPNIVDECLDEVECVYNASEFQSLKLRAAAVLAEHRPAALATSAG